MAKARKRSVKRRAKPAPSTSGKRRKATRKIGRRKRAKPGLISRAVQAMRDAGTLRGRISGPHRLEDQ